MSPLPLVEELVPPPDPVAAAERLLGQPHLLFLDSAADPLRLGRYSFLSAAPVAVVRTKGRAAPSGLEQVAALLAAHRSDPVPGLPPFQGGAAGYLAYDYGAVLERLPAPRYDDLDLPDLVLGLYDWVLAWDHAQRRAWLVSTGVPAAGSRRPARAAERLAWVKRRLAGPAGGAAGRLLPPRKLPPPAPSYPVRGLELADLIGLRSTFTRRGYLDAVTRVRDYIVAGDIFQANLSQRLEATLEEDPWALYRRLREVNPAPFAAYLEFEGVVVASASPERFLQVDPSGRVETRPIKGTRPRGLSPLHDAALSRALQESEKDRAENLMIVDLLRNDLSRVCRPGTVRVPELFALEPYRTVHHLVSTVVGRLEPGRTATDLLAAAFPGGSITGAPKVRAMEIIAELEPTRRAVYCGAIGYLSLTGAMDTSIVIRTCLVVGGRVYFSVGGGIVADSDPEAEYQETLDKARALVAALAGAVTTP
ncbi:MAG TPA: aminodeoxychorismate synthase component I [Gemmatimonadales bacterium]|nr:aminodeoxychorismate synthase component I [Gemmatimonadales bacterium]